MSTQPERKKNTQRSFLTFTQQNEAHSTSLCAWRRTSTYTIPEGKKATKKTRGKGSVFIQRALRFDSPNGKSIASEWSSLQVTARLAVILATLVSLLVFISQFDLWCQAVTGQTGIAALTVALSFYSPCRVCLHPVCCFSHCCLRQHPVFWSLLTLPTPLLSLCCSCLLSGRGSWTRLVLMNPCRLTKPPL